jgi:hypothetical protein
VITSLDVLTGEQILGVRKAVHSLRSSWIPRGSAFFTLGTPSYLDLAENPQTGDYHRRTYEYWSLLRERFDWLYQLIQDRLEEHLGAPARYREDLSLPGFHVWLAPAVFTKPRAPIHFDLQHLAFDWPPGTDPSRVLSYTLPIRLPVAGGGLNTWQATYDDFQHAMERGWIESANDLRRFYELRYVPYTVGQMVVHSGHLLHQVAPTSTVLPDDERLTLQGHAIWSVDRWLLYW